ncbi:MAG: tetratricopeptide repeat protein [Aquisalimonadaceae bacterium]
MSLINDMLRDLDRRRGPPGHGLPPGVRTGTGRSRLGTFRLAAGLAFLLLAATAAAWYLIAEWSMPGLSQFRADPATGTRSAEVVPVTPEQQLASPRASAPQVLLIEAALTETARRHRLELILDGSVEHELEEAGKTMRLHLPGVRLAADLPDLVSLVPELLAVDIRQQQEGMELVLRFDADMQTQAVMRQQADGGAVFRLDFVRHAAADSLRQLPEIVRPDPVPATRPPVPAISEGPAIEPAARQAESVGEGHMVRSPVRGQSAPRARRLYRQAVSDLQSGRTDAGIRGLEQALELEADLRPVRELLARVLSSEGRTSEAMTVLEQGLESAPDHTPYATRLARLHVREGNPRGAVAVLERSLPKTVGDGSYHALLAGLYQQTNQAAEAAALYRDLVREHPGEAVWWLGLGLSLEDDGQTDRAAAAYRRARDAGGLEAELATFIRDRIERLGN